MHAKKCDRCGNYYAPYKGQTYGGGKINTIDLQNDCGGGAVSQSVGCFDLCPSCMDKQIRFLQCLKPTSGETKRPLSVPLTLDQIIQMNGQLVVVPESLNCRGGIGRVDLKKNIINGCEPTDIFVWSLKGYGKSFIAYGIEGGKSLPFYDRGENE